MPRAKKASNKTTHTATKVVKLKHHHAKPYRKRHLGLLVVSVIGLVLILLAGIEYRTQIIGGAMSSRNFVSDLFGRPANYDLTVRSTYGFNVTFDQRNLYASAINGEGKIATGSELAQEAAYSVIRFAPSTIPDTSAQSSLTFNYHPEITYTATAATSLEAVALKDAGLDAKNLTKTATKDVILGNQAFTLTNWETKQDGTLAGGLKVTFALYTTTLGTHPLTIVVNQGLSKDMQTVYDQVLESLSFEKAVSVAAPSEAVMTRIASSRTLLDTVLSSGIAAAATGEVATSEKVAATYGPAVVKIFNVYCADMLVDGKIYAKGMCSAGAGSGFFISQDGYIGTNGHVATMNPQDIVIQDAFVMLSKGDPRFLNALIALTDLTQAELNAMPTANKQYALIIDKLYAMSASRYTATNSIQNLLVDLSDELPNIETLIQNTKDRVAYEPTPSIKAAKVVGYDYRMVDGVDGFRASDVALLKIDGSNYPVTKLGTVDLVNQGSNLSILGFPGAAGSNGIAESTTAEVTLTTGKVSSVKNALGSDKKLIETDTTIGHGNSGGPVLNDEGFVVGLATYTIDGSGEGNGVFNYIRNAQDLSDVAKAENITLDTKSLTQTAWEKGLDNFYTAHYSNSLKNFETVKTLDPYHARVQEFIDAANKRIANGEDVKDFPVIPVVIGGVVLLAGAIVAVLLIIRHKKKHAAYTAGVSQGTVTPTVRGDAAQPVTVSGPVVTPVTPLTPVAPVAETPIAEVQVSVTAPVATPVTPTPVVAAPVSIPVSQPTVSPAPIVPTSVPVSPAAPVTPPAQPVTPPTPENPWFTN